LAQSCLLFLEEDVGSFTVTEKSIGVRILHIIIYIIMIIIKQIYFN
jgi:hypothetical protein